MSPVFGPGVDQRILMVDCGTSANCVPNEAGSDTQYYFADRLGNVLAVTDNTGAIQQRFFYTPFGVEMEGDPTGNPFRYTGRRYDPETGLYYYRARYYDADLGRFLQVDPIGYADQWNLYAYVGNNPLNATDPTGMFQDIAGVGVDHYLRALALQATEGESYDSASQRVNEIDQEQFPVVLGGSLAITGAATGVGAIYVSGPLAITEASIIGSEMLLGESLGGASLAGATVTVYRVVDSAELADITATGLFRTAPGNFEGKQFVDNIADAQSLRAQFERFFGGEQSIVEGIAPQSVNDDASRIPFADIPNGQAITIRSDDLQRVRPVCTEEC